MWPSVVILFIISGIFYGISRWIDNMRTQPAGTRTSGEIRKVMQEDGLVYYYIQFETDGRILEASTEAYGNTNNKYRIGDRVPVEVFQAGSSDRYRARLLDDTLISAREYAAPKAGKTCRILAAASALIAVACVVYELFL